MNNVWFVGDRFMFRDEILTIKYIDGHGLLCTTNTTNTRFIENEYDGETLIPFRCSVNGIRINTIKPYRRILKHEL